MKRVLLVFVTSWAIAAVASHAEAHAKGFKVERILQKLIHLEDLKRAIAEVAAEKGLTLVLKEAPPTLSDRKEAKYNSNSPLNMC